MIRARLTHATVLAVAALVFSADGPLRAASLKADLQKTAAEQRRLMTATVEAMPEDSFDAKPTPEQRTFREAVLHVAGANSFLTGFTGAVFAACYPKG